MEWDFAYQGTYFFLAGCLVFSFHSFCLVHSEPSFLNWVYFTGASLFTCGSICYAVDAERRRDGHTQQSLTPRKVS